MKLFLDFLPIVVFFLAYKLYDIYVATAAIMVTTVLQMGYVYFREGRLEKIQQITLLIVLIFGALTLSLHDERFIKWKPTFLYAGMALALAIALWGYKKNFLQLLLSKQLSLAEHVWTKLNFAWIAYCIFMASINAFFAAFFSTDTWVNFKLWGYLFPVIFLLGQALFIAKHLEKSD